MPSPWPRSLRALRLLRLLRPLQLLRLLAVVQLVRGAPFLASRTQCDVPPAQTQCLPQLRTRPSDYAPCKRTTCYLFISEPPFIELPRPSARRIPVTPFACHTPAPFSGIAFRLHAFTAPALCVYAGPRCSFNDLVQFTRVRHEYAFAITGLLMYTPDRFCHHTPAAPLLSDQMVVVGRAPELRSPAYQLVRPFSARTWLVCLSIAFILLVVALTIAFCSRGKPSITTALLVAAGDSTAALRTDPIFHRNAPTPRSNHDWLTRFGVSISLLKLSTLVFFAMLALFYEAAVVNFLFEQNTAELGKRIRRLSPRELAQYAVLKDSALESAWNSTINPHGDLYDPNTQQPPWQRCASMQQCIAWVADPHHPVQFDVTFSIGARYLIQQLSSCQELTIFQTKDILYHFNGGWINSNGVSQDFQKRVDRNLLGLRINGSMRQLVDDRLGGSACTENTETEIGPLVILIPIMICVLPPLLGSVFVLFFWRPPRRPSSTNCADAHDDHAMEATSAASSDPLVDASSARLEQPEMIGESAFVSVDAVLRDPPHAPRQHSYATRVASDASAPTLPQSPPHRRHLG